MAYTGLDLTKPDGATQNGTQVLQSIRDNQRALRDMIVSGFAAGWAMTLSGGTAGQPAQILKSAGTERLRATLTWGTTGGEAGNVTKSVYAYSSNSGGSYDTVGTLSISYDSAGYVTGTTWS